MKKYIIPLVLFASILSCNTSKQNQAESAEVTLETSSATETSLIRAIPKLNLKGANTLVKLPLYCLNTEYPNKLSQTLGSVNDLKSPSQLHPTFYGCFDWHSAVHGHWSLVSLLKQFPEIDDAAKIEQKLRQNMSKVNIDKELEYFNGEYNKTFERTYGWAWLLKLTEELHTWDAPIARELETNLKPLTDFMVDKYLEFLPKLNYPLRVGTHTNTAFGLSFAYDYAETMNHTALKEAITKRAKFFYLNDKDCPISWEPSGSDFLSPCLEEAALMKRILPHDAFKIWLADFFPQLKDKTFRLEPGKVFDRTDGHLVHLDGLNFSRAWSLNKIAEGLPEYKHLEYVAHHHINYSLPNVIDDSYEGGHWLGTFAIYALNSVKNN